MPEKLVYDTCRFILPSGRLCKNPQEKNRSCCIHHNRERQRKRNLAKAREIKDLSNPKRPEAEYRPIDDLNAAIWESLNIPTLEDKESISIAAFHVMNALGCHHLDPHRGKVMAHLIHIAELNLRKSKPFFHTHDVPGGLTDTDPVKPFGDEAGFVLPEENSAHRSHQLLVEDFGADRAHQIRTNLGFNDHMLEPLDSSADSTAPRAPSAPAAPSPHSAQSPGSRPISSSTSKDATQSA